MRSSREAESPGEAGLPLLRVGDDASTHLRNGGTDCRRHGACRGWRMDTQRFACPEYPSGPGMAQPARSAARALAEFPRPVENALMSRESILHRVRTALG